MKRIFTVAQIKKQELKLIADGTDEIELTKRVAKAVDKHVENVSSVAIFCGSGNNGGDGVAIANNLVRRGIKVKVVFASERKSDTSKYFLKLCERSISCEVWSGSFDFSPFDLVVDCLLGVGFVGQMKENLIQIVQAINDSGKKVLSVDIPSGLNGDSGRTNLAVKSDKTIVVGALKGGVLLNDAKDFCGNVEVVDIGLFDESDAFLVEKQDFADVDFKRKQNSHKGSFGLAGIIAGCLEYSGASKLASISLSALKNGCGISRLIVPDCIASVVAPFLLESTLKTVDSINGCLKFSKDKIDDAIKGLTSLAFGMGLGNSEEVFETLKYILKNKNLNLIIDADGINVLARSPSLLLETKCKVLLTPHVKEFSRLSGATVDEILDNPILHAKNFALKNNVIVLLKGATTVVSDGKISYIVNRGCVGMATAGSGDVLSGILSGLFAYLPISAKNVALGAFINGLAGEKAQKESNGISMVASDTVNQIANAINELID